MTPVLYLARAAALPIEAGDVQMFPPGRQTIVPLPADGAKPEPLEVVIEAATAEALEAQRAAYQAKADAGEGDAP